MAIFLAIATPGCATDPVAQSQQSSAISPDRVAQHVESFEYIWESVKKKHWDPDLNGVDWDQAKADLLPQVQNAQSDSQARAVMGQLLSKLGQSHFGIIPGSAYDQLEEESTVKSTPSNDETNNTTENKETEKGPGWSGLDLRLIQGQFLVTKVTKDSPADQAGIHTGWIVNSIRGRNMQSLIDLTQDIEGVTRPETQAGLIAYGRVRGNIGDTFKITLTDENNQTQERTIKLARAPGIMAGIGALPDSPIETEVRTLDNGVGYFRLSMFMSPNTVIPTYQKFIKDHIDAPGLIIDMRGNFGGIIMMAPGMINWLISEKDLTLGAMKMRDEARGPFDIPFVLNPRRKSYTGKVAVLIDELSISNAEIFAAGLKDIGRATIFGTRSAGLVLPSTVDRLPNGDGFQYAFASYTTGGGYSLEGQGAVPDVEIQNTRQGLLQGRDEVLQSALDWINND